MGFSRPADTPVCTCQVKTSYSLVSVRHLVTASSPRFEHRRIELHPAELHGTRYNRLSLSANYKLPFLFQPTLHQSATAILAPRSASPIPLACLVHRNWLSVVEVVVSKKVPPFLLRFEHAEYTVHFTKVARQTQKVVAIVRKAWPLRFVLLWRIPEKWITHGCIRPLDIVGDQIAWGLSEIEPVRRLKIMPTASSRPIPMVPLAGPS